MTPAEAMSDVVQALWRQLQSGWDAWMVSKPYGQDQLLRALDGRIRELDGQKRADVLAGRLSLERWHGIAAAIADGIAYATGQANSSKPWLERFWDEVIVETGKDVAKVAAIGLPIVGLLLVAGAGLYLYLMKGKLV